MSDLEIVHIRIPDDLKTEIEERAKKNRRSLTGQIVFDLEEKYKEEKTK